MKPVVDELDLHGLTVDEALPVLEKFLYTAFKAKRHRVWVIHGKGTGVLRQEMRRYLSTHTLVRSFSAADGAHGGIGATEVFLNNY